MEIREARRILAVRWYHSRQAIRRRFALQVREAHPDQGGDPSRLVRIREAYEVLVERMRPRPGGRALPSPRQGRHLAAPGNPRCLPLPRPRPAERPLPLLRRALWHAVRRGEETEALLWELGRLCARRRDLLPRATAFLDILPLGSSPEERILRRQEAVALIRRIATGEEPG